MDNMIYQSKVSLALVVEMRRQGNTNFFNSRSYETIVYRENNEYYDILHDNQKLVNSKDTRYEVNTIKRIFPKENGNKVISVRKLQNKYSKLK